MKILSNAHYVIANVYVNVHVKEKPISIYVIYAIKQIINAFVNVIANIFANIQFCCIILFVFVLISKDLEHLKDQMNKIYKWH